MMPKKKKYLPKISKKISSYLVEERGGISKHKMISIGAFLGSISLLNLLPDVQAAHSNYFSVGWNSGTLTAKHGHHASHASHSSHGSHGSHSSHTSHASHGSHSSHTSHGSHASHSIHVSHSIHASHSLHNSHSLHMSHSIHASHSQHGSHSNSCDLFGPFTC